MAARPSWRGQIRLALVAIPVEIYPATKSGASIAFHQIHEPSGKRGERGENWMLKKVTDEFASNAGEALVEQALSSVTTGRTMAEIADGADVWESNQRGNAGGRTKRKPGIAPPAFRAPQLATLVDAVPTGSDWMFEYKYDGYRLLLATGGGAATAWTRGGNDWSDKFRGIVKAAADLPGGCLIDGEAVALGANGRPDFQLLQASLKGGKADLAFYAFDLIVDQGEDISKLGNLERKQRLAALLKGVGGPILYGDHILAKGEALFEAICKERGEGIIAKKASAPYRSSRAKSWLKVKCTKRADQVVREVAEKLPAKAGKASLASRATFASLGARITNPDRVIFPGDEITKGQLADYYAAIAAPIMVDAANRPLTLIRCPQGRSEHCFFQKHDSGSMGEFVHHVPISEKDGSTEDYLFVDRVEGLLGCVQMGTIEFHGWGSRIDPLEKPDRMVFDLDPDEGLDFGAVRAGAERLRALLGDLGLETFPLLSGGKGIHVVAPLDQSADWPAVKSFAERFSRAIAEKFPDEFTANIRKNQRTGRIFIDWLRNQRGATAVLPYSVRAREGAPVAAPIDWSEVASTKGANRFTIGDVDELLDRAASPILAGWGRAKQSLPDL